MVTQKPEGIRQDGIWDVVEFWLLIVLAAIAGAAVFILAPVGGLLGAVVLPVATAIAVGLLGYYLIRLSYTFLLVAVIFVVMILWSWRQTPFVGDTLYFPGDPGYETMVNIGRQTSTSTVDVYPGRISILPWEQPVRILVDDDSVCIGAKGVKWDGTPVTVYSSASGTVEIQNTCRLLFEGAVEIKDVRAK